MANHELNELRAQARKRHRAATQKVSRLRRVQDVELKGTRYDPRRDPSRIRSYNAPQLRAYINQLNAFTSRDTQYLRGARGTVVSKKSWNEFQRAQVAVSRRNREEFSKIAGIFVPRFNQTIGERIAMLAKPSRMGSNLAANRPFDEISRSARGLMGDKGARIQTEALLKRLSKDWLPSRIKADRETFKKMAEIVNEPTLASAVDDLTPNQFNVLWNYTGFANSVSLHYENMKKSLMGADEPWHMSTSSDAVEESRALIEWVKTLNLGR